MTFRALSLLVAILYIAGCHSANRLDFVRPGMSVEELKRCHLQAHNDSTAEMLPLKHHFTIEDSGHVLMALTGFVNEGWPFLFLFKDSELHSIYEALTEGMFEECTRPIDFLKLLNTKEALSIGQFRAAVVARQDRGEEQHYAGRMPLVSSQFRNPEDYQECLRRAARYDATKVMIGSPINEVDSLFPMPGYVSSTSSGQDIRIYGESSDIGSYANPRVVVYVKDGRVEYVVTRYRFPPDFLRLD